MLRFIDPDTFRVLRQIQVSDTGGKKIKQLNELEFIDGEIWANVWYEDVIARISPDNGRIVGWVDLGDVYPKQQRDKESVMNGIAYDKDSKRLFITGKNWPKLYEIKVIDRQDIELGVTQQQSIDEAIERAFQGVGKGMVMTTAVLVAGFASVMFSETRDYRVFGSLGAITLLTALICDLFMLPALLKQFDRRSTESKTPNVST